MNSGPVLEGSRICLNCTAEDVIAQRDALWPLGWVCPNCGSRLTANDGIVQLAPELDETEEGYDLESFAFLEKVEDAHFWFRSRNVLIEWLVRSHAPQARRVLEIGCGTGFVLNALREALPGAMICGSELHSKGLAIAKKRHGDNIEFIQMDARRTGLRGCVDLVGAFDVLEHIEEDEAVLAQCARLLRPGGVLIATVPQHRFMWSVHDDIAHHVRRYRRGELAKKAEAAGLSTLYQSSFVTLAFPFMALSRMISGGSGHRPQDRSHAEAEFALPTAVNSAMLALQKAEHMLRRAGVVLPFGGSQVLVARKP
jgi:SAM-dependent methyltransferase